MLVQRLEGFFRWQRIITAGLLVSVMVFVLFGNQLSALFAKTCPERPVYSQDITTEHNAMLDTLFDKGFLYCVEPPADLEALSTPVYWGSDGMDAVLYFPVNSLEGLTVFKYAYYGSAGSDMFFVTPEGDAPIPGFEQDVPSRAMINQAPEGAKYFFRVDGAPRMNDRGVHVELKGPVRQDAGLEGRDAFRDLERLSRLLKRSPDASNPSLMAIADFLIYPPHWDGAVRRKVDPRLATSDGRPDPGALRNIDNLADPSVYQTVSGLFGSTIWVVGAISKTLPALVLADAGRTEIPKTDMGWEAANGSLRLHNFAFDPLKAGKTYEARYWHDRRNQATSPPDRVWPVSFP